MAQNGSAPAIELPNPFTPLAFFPEDVANKLSLVVHFAVTCLGITIWDALNYVAEDYQVVFRRKFSWRTAVFIVARLSPMAFLLTISILFTAKLDSCRIPHYTWISFFYVAEISTSLLFYFRVCAVYNGNRYVAAFFGFTVLSVVGVRLLPYWGTTEAHVGPTKYCIALVKAKYLLAGTMTEMVNDVLTFWAIMYKLNRTRVELGGKSWVTSLFRKPTSQRISDIFVQDSQIYYFIAIAMNLAVIIFFFIMANPPDSPIRVLLMFPRTVVVNAIAIRVYRNMRLGRPGLYSSTGEHEVSKMSRATYELSQVKFGKDREVQTANGETRGRDDDRERGMPPLSVFVTSSTNKMLD